MAFTDQNLYCRDCNQEFVFTAGEQEFFASRGLVNAPSRCPSCRAARKAAGMNGGGGGGGFRGGPPGAPAPPAVPAGGSAARGGAPPGPPPPPGAPPPRSARGLPGR